VTGQYGDLSSTVLNPLGSGTIATTGFGLGATATWYGNQGMYVDAQGQVNWLDSDLASSGAGDLISGHSSTAYALSLEVGQTFKLSETGTLIPQAQLTMDTLDGGSFTDSVGNAVDLGSKSTTVGRVGLAYEYVTPASANKFYVIGNVVHDFSGSSAVNVADASLSTSAASDTWGEIGLGGSYAVADDMVLYGGISYRQSFDNSKDNSLATTAGLRIQW
jgi:fibronectin-binding autotransporter adhesin